VSLLCPSLLPMAMCSSQKDTVRTLTSTCSSPKMSFPSKSRESLRHQVGHGSDHCSLVSDLTWLTEEAPVPIAPSNTLKQPSSAQPPAKRAKITGRKRDRAAASLRDGDDGAVLLSVDKLSAMSSQKLEEYAQNLAELRPLTSEEEKQLKRQKRLIKNRESAQLSRQRKKHYVEELEAQVKALTAENLQMQAQMQQINTKNQQLESQVLYWRGLSQQEQLAVAEDSKLFNSKNTAKAGLCVLVILFSFGLFMNTISPNDATLRLKSSASR